MIEIVRESRPADFLELIYLKGSLDTHTAYDFERFFQEFISTGHYFFIIDASHLHIISSGGLGALLRLVEQLKPLGGSFTLVHLNPEIELLFSFLDLGKVIGIFTDMEDAIGFLQEAAAQARGLGQIPASQSFAPSIPEVEAEPHPESSLPTGLTSPKESLVACSYCGLPLRAPRSGAYMCPGCGHQFQVDLG